MKIVRNTESDEREVLGTFIATDEEGDVVMYRDEDGVTRMAPYDCVAIEDMPGKAPLNVNLAPPSSRRIVIDLYDHTSVEEIEDILRRSARDRPGRHAGRGQQEAQPEPGRQDRRRRGSRDRGVRARGRYADGGVNPHSVMTLADGYVTLPRDNALTRLGQRESR